MAKLEKKLYPITAEVEEQAAYLSRLPEKVYQMFVRQGIPSAVASRIKRKEL